MDERDWMMSFPGAITLCDPDGVIVYMNSAASRLFEKNGGSRLVGSNVLDCHPEPSRSKLKQLLEGGQTNIYTVEKNGIRKLIYQAPWYEAGRYAGFMELSLPIPSQIPNYERL